MIVNANVSPGRGCERRVLSGSVGRRGQLQQCQQNETEAADYSGGARGGHDGGVLPACAIV